MESTSADFVAEFDALCRKHGLGFDDALEELSEAVGGDAAKPEHPEVVRNLLESAQEHLRFAAFNIYASYK